ncbi:hypothetical protein JZU61_02295 [bacterium]|nr:hypothetical protein [bacterium]
MIKTQEIKITANEFFRLILSIYLKKRWWLVAWIWILIVILLLGGSIGLIEIFLLAFILLFQVIIVGQYWFYAHSKDNRIYLMARHYEIDSGQVVELMEDGTSSTIKTKRFIKMMKTPRYYLLYVARNEYIYLPVCAFHSLADLEWFENEVVNKIKK